ncbi:MAG TPA: bestrophin family ion channel [Polyangiales bacterium]|nr:bestrophin family ion channel [Polyangiales bacterium]
MLLEGRHSLARLLRTTVKIVIPLTVLSYAVLWAYRSTSLGTGSLLYNKIGYVLSAISIFIAFRVNQAYGRWWEARQLWGSLINESRSWGRLVVTHFSSRAPLSRDLLMRQIAYVNILRIALRHGTAEKGRAMMKAQLRRLLPEEDDAIVDRSKNVPTQLLVSQAATIEEALSSGLESRLVWSQLTGILSTINAAQGGCERIKNTVFPAGITHFTRFMVWAMAPLMTFAILGDSDRYDAIELPVVILVTSIFVVIEQLARELQTPFENAPDDTPMNAICVTIETDLRQMLGDGDLPAQEQPVRGVLM